MFVCVVQAKWAFGGDQTKKRTKIGEDLPQLITRSFALSMQVLPIPFRVWFRKSSGTSPSPLLFQVGPSHQHRHEFLSHPIYFNDSSP